jgi:hypothetical protein
MVYGTTSDPVVLQRKLWTGKRSRCPACATAICFECLQPFHPLLECAEVEDFEMNEWKKGRDAGQCPKCRAHIERSSGCNHMTCFSCKYEFCWLCSADYGGGRHFGGSGCPQFGGLTEHQKAAVTETNLVAFLWLPTGLYCMLQCRSILALLLEVLTDGSWLMWMVQVVGPTMPYYSLPVCVIGGLIARSPQWYIHNSGRVRIGPFSGERAHWWHKKAVNVLANVGPHMSAPWIALIGAWLFSKLAGVCTYFLSSYYFPLPYVAIRALLWCAKGIAWFAAVPSVCALMWFGVATDFTFVVGHVPSEEQILGEFGSNTVQTLYMVVRMFMTQLHFITLYTAAGYHATIGFAPVVAFAVGWMLISVLLMCLRDLDSRSRNEHLAPHARICLRVVQFVPVMICTTAFAAVYAYVRPFDVEFLDGGPCLETAAQGGWLDWLPWSSSPDGEACDVGAWLRSTLCDDRQEASRGSKIFGDAMAAHVSECHDRADGIERAMKLAGYPSIERLFGRRVWEQELRFIGVDADDIEMIAAQVAQTTMIVVARSWSFSSLFFWLCQMVALLQLVVMLAAMVVSTVSTRFQSRDSISDIAVTAIGLSVMLYAVYHGVDYTVCGISPATFGFSVSQKFGSSAWAEWVILGIMLCVRFMGYLGNTQHGFIRRSWRLLLFYAAYMLLNYFTGWFTDMLLTKIVLAGLTLLRNGTVARKQQLAAASLALLVAVVVYQQGVFSSSDPLSGAGGATPVPEDGGALRAALLKHDQWSEEGLLTSAEVAAYKSMLVSGAGLVRDPQGALDSILTRGQDLWKWSTDEGAWSLSPSQDDIEEEEAAKQKQKYFAVAGGGETEGYQNRATVDYYLSADSGGARPPDAAELTELAEGIVGVELDTVAGWVAAVSGVFEPQPDTPAGIEHTAVESMATPADSSGGGGDELSDSMAGRFFSAISGLPGSVGGLFQPKAGAPGADIGAVQTTEGESADQLNSDGSIPDDDSSRPSVRSWTAEETAEWAEAERIDDEVIFGIRHSQVDGKMLLDVDWEDDRYWDELVGQRPKPRLRLRGMKEALEKLKKELDDGDGDSDGDNDGDGLPASVDDRNDDGTGYTGDGGVDDSECESLLCDGRKKFVLKVAALRRCCGEGRAGFRQPTFAAASLGPDRELAASAPTKFFDRASSGGLPASVDDWNATAVAAWAVAVFGEPLYTRPVHQFGDAGGGAKVNFTGLTRTLGQL